MYPGHCKRVAPIPSFARDGQGKLGRSLFYQES